MEVISFLLSDKMQILFGLAALVGAMIYYCYRPFGDKPPRPIPHEFLKGDQKVDDPFRSPQAMNRRLEDLGRHNVRANQGDGRASDLQLALQAQLAPPPETRVCSPAPVGWAGSQRRRAIAPPRRFGAAADCNEAVSTSVIG